ncbi:MAG: 16S rRNA (adenine(1518)-N(6)/adenine(1519)-N(6))-dimethyltransferase RsmA [Rhodospirillales bacterium]|nr:16S rRNA (adenine(1518)-N(6)/adenine(1519)-N(6))-dimethyltransferase RsmA [Rhodospirillales bacterium]
MSALEALPPLRDVIAAHNLRAEKALGQNFLLDLNMTDKIARQAGDLSGKTVIEIGPGPGGLTRSLLRVGAKKVIAVEFDLRAVGALQALVQAAEGRLTVVQADALEVDLATLCEGPRVIVANLPYNIATPLLTGWLAQIRSGFGVYDEMILMFQKEVAQRIVARPGDKAYGRLSVISQWLCETRKCFDLPPGAFTPPPKVSSSVVRFVPKVLAAEAPEFKAVEAVTAAAFGQRRKMIRSSLRDYAQRFGALGLEPTVRAETLSVEDFIQLAKY